MGSLLVMAALVLVMGPGCQNSSMAHLRSPDPQVRCDAFHELFGDLEGTDEKPSRKMLYGKTTREIHALLGEPSSVSSLIYNGASWLSVSYMFQVCPTKGSRTAWEKGWRYSPAVVFRNGIAAPYDTFAKEVGVGPWGIASTIPEAKRFRPGGVFP